MIENDEEENQVCPDVAPDQDAVAPETAGALATSLMRSVTARNATLREFDSSLVWMNIMWVVVFVAVIVVIEMVPAAEEFLKHVVLIFRNRTLTQ